MCLVQILDDGLGVLNGNPLVGELHVVGLELQNALVSIVQLPEAPAVRIRWVSQQASTDRQPDILAVARLSTHPVAGRAESMNHATRSHDRNITSA